MNINVLSVTFFVVFLTGCIREGDSGLPVFDAGAAINNRKTFDLADIADDFKFTVLDNGYGDTFVGNIRTIQESKRGFYIVDDSREPVRLFDKTGAFIATRGSLGRGPNELSYISDIAVDYEQDNIYVRGGQKIFAYNTEGKLFARKDSILRGQDIAYQSDELIVLKYSDGSTIGTNNKTTFLETFSSNLQHKNGVEVLNRDVSTIVTNLPGSTVSVRYTDPCVMWDDGYRILAKEIWNDTVFHYKDERILTPAYLLDFGNHSAPLEAFGRKATAPWNKDYYWITAVWEGLTTMIVKVFNVDSPDSVPYLILSKHEPYDGFLATGTDGKPGLYLDGVAFTPCDVRDNRLIGYIQALDIVDNREAITNPDLKALAATLKEDSNPVIVIAKLKK